MFYLYVFDCVCILLAPAVIAIEYLRRPKMVYSDMDQMNRLQGLMDGAITDPLEPLDVEAMNEEAEFLMARTETLASEDGEFTLLFEPELDIDDSPELVQPVDPNWLCSWHSGYNHWLTICNKWTS
jgi:hypothetical protein